MDWNTSSLENETWDRLSENRASSSVLHLLPAEAWTPGTASDSGWSPASTCRLILSPSGLTRLWWWTDHCINSWHLNQRSIRVHTALKRLSGAHIEAMELWFLVTALLHFFTILFLQICCLFMLTWQPHLDLLYIYSWEYIVVIQQSYFSF